MSTLQCHEKLNLSVYDTSCYCNQLTGDKITHGSFKTELKYITEIWAVGAYHRNEWSVPCVKSQKKPRTCIPAKGKTTLREVNDFVAVNNND